MQEVDLHVDVLRTSLRSTASTAPETLLAAVKDLGTLVKLRLVLTLAALVDIGEQRDVSSDFFFTRLLQVHI